MNEKSDLNHKRRLLPVWIKIFLWMFLVMACFIPVVIIMNALKIRSQLSIYGIESDSVFNLPGFIISVLIIYKGIVAYGLWTGRKWAVSNAIIDAITGICICCIMMLLPFFISNNVHFILRLELIALIPYLIKMRQIKYEWTDTEPPETIHKTQAEINDAEPKTVIYKEHTYKCEDGILTIMQEFQNPNVGERVFLNDKPAPFGKYKIGFMFHIFVDDGMIREIN